MTVKELIEELQKYNETRQIYISCDYSCCDGLSDIEVEEESIDGRLKPYIILQATE